MFGTRDRDEGERAIEKHCAGIIENWDGVQQAPEAQIRAARESRGRSMDVTTGNFRVLTNHEIPAKSR